jgi:hypothetical protein
VWDLGGNGGEKVDKELFIEQHKELNNNIRFYADARFKQLTLFLAAITAIFYSIFNYISNAETIPLTSTIGVIVTLIFWIQEERAADHYHYYLKWLKNLEENNEIYEIYNSKDHKLEIKQSATNAIRLLFFAIYIMLLIIGFNGLQDQIANLLCTIIFIVINVGFPVGMIFWRYNTYEKIKKNELIIKENCKKISKVASKKKSDEG